MMIVVLIIVFICLVFLNIPTPRRDWRASKRKTSGWMLSRYRPHDRL